MSVHPNDIIISIFIMEGSSGLVDIWVTRLCNGRVLLLPFQRVTGLFII